MSDNHEPFSRSRRLTRVIVAITDNAKGKVRVSDDFVFLVRQIINEHVIMPVQDEGKILYVESNDDVTTVIASGGRRFKNYTPISRWEAILSPHFIRIHRSYLVNPVAVTRVDVDLLYIDDIQLPISKKYKDAGHAGALLRARGGEK